jgi:hypothetical protein
MTESIADLRLRVIHHYDAGAGDAPLDVISLDDGPHVSFWTDSDEARAQALALAEWRKERGEALFVADGRRATVLEPDKGRTRVTLRDDVSLVDGAEVAL